jgi:PAS domain S-box-containing protein
VSPLAPFKRLSLTTRILLMMGLTLVLSYPVSIFLLIDSQLTLYRDAAAEDLSTTLGTLERMVGEQVVIGDYALIEQILRARARHSHFLELDFTDSDGNVIAVTSPQRPARYPGWFRNWFNLPERPVARDITIGGRNYGRVTLWPSHVGFYNHVWRGVVQQGAVVLGAGIALFVFVALVLRRGLQPLRVTTELALSLRRGEYQCLAVPPGSAAPEIRDTIATFNDAASREAWLARFAEIISGSEPSMTKVQSVMRLLCARLDMDGAVLAWDDGARGATVLASCHVDPAAQGLRWEEFTREALALNVPVTADEELRLASGVAPAGAVAYMAVPARMGAHRTGVFSLFRQAGRTISNPNGEVELMELAANWMGATLAEEEQERQLWEQREHAETVLRNVAEGIVTLDLDGLIVSANPSMEHIFGLPAQRLIGQAIMSFVPGLEWGKFRSAVATQQAERAPAAIAGQETGRRADGRTILIELSARAVQHGDAGLIIAVIRDVTERVRVEGALRRSEARRQRAQEIARLGSLEYFPQSGQARWASELGWIFGLTPEADRSYGDFFAHIDHADSARVREAFEAGVREGRPFNVEFRVVRPNGDRRYVVLSAEAPELTEQGSRVFAVAQDVTERREAEARMQAALVEKLEAEAHNRAKTLFLANMSHELRTPLNAILGYSEMLAEEAAAEGRDVAAADLHKIQAAGRHLLNMINEVLDLSKIEAGRMDLQLEECAVRSLVEEVTATIEPLAAQNRNVLRVSVDLYGQVMRTDPMKVKQILINLLGNACKFTADGEVAFICTHEVEDGREWVCFTVRDTGIGISASQLDRLFEPFIQADAATARKYGGTGLGLAISKHFVEMLGGEIVVDSMPQRGSTFIVRLPLETRPAREQPAKVDDTVRVTEAGDQRLAAQPVPDRRAQVSTWAYDHQGRGILSYKGPAPQSGQAGIEQVRLDYPTPGKTILTNSLGQKTAYSRTEDHMALRDRPVAPLPPALPLQASESKTG